jgi:hypothetical protein
MSINIQDIIDVKNPIDKTIIYDLNKKEDLIKQLTFWKPLIANNSILFNFIKTISYYDFYNRYELQKDIGIKCFYDFVICEFIRSEKFKSLNEIEQEIIQKLLKGRLQ